MKARVFHGWKVVGAGAALSAIQSAFLVQGYGQFAVVLEQQFGWSKTFFGAGYSLNRAESGLLGPFQGWALDKFGTKAVMRVGIVMMAIGFALFSMINSKVEFVGALLIAAIGASLSGFLSTTTGTVKWFEAKRARALALMSTGFAIGGGMIPLVVFALERFGWRHTALGMSAIILLVGWPLTYLFADTPATRGDFVDGIDPATISDSAFVAEGVSAVHFTAAQALRTRSFWTISLGHTSALLVVGAVIAHLSLYLTSEQGFSQKSASFVILGLTVCQLLGMLCGGILGDKVNKRWLASSAMLGHMIGLLLLAWAESRWMIWLFVPFHGLAWGVRGPLMQALRADYFGSTHFGKIMGFSSLIVMLGMVGGPFFAGVLADQTGSYRIGFTILAVAAGLGMSFFILSVPPTQPAENTKLPISA